MEAAIGLSDCRGVPCAAPCDFRNSGDVLHARDSGGVLQARDLGGVLQAKRALQELMSQTLTPQ